jgi:hypothetical protein
MLLAVAGLMLTQRLVPLSLRESHNSPIGITYSGVYLLFGVMVGFSAFLVLNKYHTSQETTQTEAGYVEEIYWLAEEFPEPKRDQIQGLAVSYARVVVNEEWLLMRQGRTSPRAEALVIELRRSIQDFEPSTQTENALYAQELERVHDLDQARQVRLLNVHEGLPPILWVVLGGLGISTILFAYLVGMKNLRLHMFTVSVLAAGIALVLLTIVALDHPFGTNLRVSPEPFESVLHTIEVNGE